MASSSQKPNFDTTSGQVFKETSALISKISPFRWVSSCKGSTRSIQRRKNQNGPASLLNTALRSVVVNCRDLTAETLTNVPWTPFGKWVWHGIKAEGLGSVAVWQAFITAYSQECDSELQICTPVPIPPEILTLTFPYLSSSNTQHLTLLSMFDCPLSRAEWVGLAKLTNLRLLTIQDFGKQMENLDDTVIRTWGIHAADEGAFPHLHTILLRNQSNISIAALHSLSSLPSLQVCHFSGPHFRARKVKDMNCFGWKHLLEGAEYEFVRSFNRFGPSYQVHGSCPPNYPNRDEILELHEYLSRKYPNHKQQLELPTLNAQCGLANPPARAVSSDQLWFLRIGPRPIKRTLDQASLAMQDLGRKKVALRRGSRKDMGSVLAGLSAR